MTVNTTEHHPQQPGAPHSEGGHEHAHHHGHNHYGDVPQAIRRFGIGGNLAVMAFGIGGNLGFTPVPEVADGALGVGLPDALLGANGPVFADGLHNGADAAVIALHGRPDKERLLYAGISVTSAITGAKASVDLATGLLAAKPEVMPPALSATVAAVGSFALSTAMLAASLRHYVHKTRETMAGQLLRERRRHGRDFLHHMAGDMLGSSIALGGLLAYNSPTVTSAATVGLSAAMMRRFWPAKANAYAAAGPVEAEPAAPAVVPVPPRMPRYTQPAEPAPLPRAFVPLDTLIPRQHAPNNVKVEPPTPRRRGRYHGRHRKKDAPEYQRAFWTRSRRRNLAVLAVAGALASGVLAASGQNTSPEPRLATTHQAPPPPDRQLAESPLDVGDSLRLGMLDMTPPPPPPPPAERAVVVKPEQGWFDVFKALNIATAHWSGLLAQAGPSLQNRGLAYYDNVAGEYRIAKPGELPLDVTAWLRSLAASS